ncbi:hypothetical protein [Haliangium ochraceum]|uniref:Uncharacterized protein n=1 Tax=Haliangium ochraceum (strain DSM 14365 / JCM 11303 / SMP-2) TaxID=502025 RepID=D0LI02_HALO1|nr:hypothetical protein [Haliangium ochraceum]ACY14831.1 hypothetical protein Hoch_2288 [Haliangium ochraceum DSM 14365]
MDSLIYALRTGIEYALAPFDALPPFWALTLLSLLSGVFMLWVVGKTTPQKRVEVARARMASAIYEIRLFLDSPGRIIKSQGRLLGWSFAYVGYMMPAFILLSLPLGLLFLHLDVRYGQEPLPTAAPIVVQVSLSDADEASAAALAATIAPGELPAGIVSTAPPVRVLDEGRVYMRVRVDQPGSYLLPVRVGDAVVEKRLDAAPGAEQVSLERCRGACLWASFGYEEPLPDGLGIDSIAAVHPPAPDTWEGVPMPWWVYWLLLATIAALALRRRMNVTL